MKTSALVLCGVLVATGSFAQPPRVVNARVAARAADPDLARAIAAIARDQVEPAWLGYAVPQLNRDPGRRNDGWSERCRLEQTTTDSIGNNSVAGPIRLEPASTVLVLMRLQSREGIGRAHV